MRATADGGASAHDRGRPRAPRGPAVGRLLLRAVAIAGMVAAPLAYIDGSGYLPAIQALLPVAGLVGLVIALLAAFCREWLGAVVATVAALALLAPVLPLAPRPGIPEPGTHGADLVVVTLNTEFGSADPGEIVAEVRARRPDVLVLVEETPDHWRSLGEHGLAELLPHATGTVSPRADGTVVVTRAPVTCLGGSPRCGEVVLDRRHAPDGVEPFAQIDVRLSDGTVLRGAHPFPPVVPGVDVWRASMDRMGAWAAGTHADEPRLVLTGDLNAGPTHPAFRAATRGLVQAPRAWPWQPTWPQGAPVPPFVQIDHVLGRGFAVVDEGVWRAPGTDHAGVWAQLRPLR